LQYAINQAFEFYNYQLEWLYIRIRGFNVTNLS
jgi:hypothetical protein